MNRYACVRGNPGSGRPVSGFRRLARRSLVTAASLTVISSLSSLSFAATVGFSTFLGGNSDETAYAVATDSAGNTYVAGSADSSNFPATSGAFQKSSPGAGGKHAFVAKFSPAGSLVYATWLGGSGNDTAYGIAVDSNGNAYVTGSTTSTDFPVTSGALNSRYRGAVSNAFVTELNAAGSALIFSTYLGGSGQDVGYAIAVDAAGEPTITGSTNSSDFPVTAHAYQSSFGGGSSDALVTRINSAGTTLVYSTYLGGSGDDVGYGVALDSSANAYVTGDTTSANFPATAGVAQTALAGSDDAFVTALDTSGTTLVYSTFLGGSNSDSGFGIAVDSSANAYITGYTSSTNYPHTPGALQTTLAGSDDAMVTKLSPTGTLAWSTFLGGSGDETGWAISVDSSGNAWVTGYTNSSDFPLASATQRTFAGESNAFVSKVFSSGAALSLSTYLGGSVSDVGYGVAVNPAGGASVAGVATSPNFPVTSAVQATLGGSSDAFVVRYLVTPVLGITATHSGNFSVGQSGATYSITVSNTGDGATAGQVTATDTLPAGLTASAIGGAGWTCVVASLTCTRSDGLSASASYPAITVTVNVTATSVGIVLNQATASGGGAAGASASDLTLIGGSGTTAQTIAFAALPNVAFSANPVSISATASSGLAVSFQSTTTPVCTVTGNTLTLVATGTCSITAVQFGNSAYAAAAAVTRSFIVTPGSQTIAFAALSGKTLGTPPFAISASASSGLPVSFTSTTASVCTVAGNIVTLVNTGACTISASQAGNVNYAAAPSVSQSFVVSPASSGGGTGGGGLGSQTITFAALSGKTLGTPPFAIGASASSGLPVSFTSTTASVCTVAGNIVTLVNTGACAISASQAGNVNYAAAPSVSQSFVVSPASSGGGGAPAPLAAAPSSLTFNYKLGATTLPSAQTLTITSGSTSESYTSVVQTASGGNWLSAAILAFNYTPGSVSVSVSIARLVPGTYTGSVTISSSGVASVTVPVTLIVTSSIPVTPVLNVSPPAHKFVLTQSTAPASGSFTISNIGGGTLSYQASAASGQGNWLSITSGATGSVSAGASTSVAFTVNPAQLAAGAYTGQITVTDTGSNAQQQVSVTLVVSQAAASLALSQAAITLTTVAGGAQPPAQSFTVSNSGGGALNWTAQTQTLSGANWLSVSPASGGSIGGQPGVPVSVSANPAGLAAGQYYGSVNVLATGAPNSPQTVSVLLNVLPVPQNGTAGISLSSGGMVLLGAAGDTSTAQRQFSIFNPSTGVTFTAAASPANSWLSVSPASGSLSTGATAITIQANFATLSAGLQTGAVTLTFSDGTSATVQVLAIATPAPASTGSFRRANAVLAPCTSGAGASLVSVFDQPVSNAALTAGVPASVQVELFDNCGNAVTSAAGGSAQVNFSNGDPAITLNDIGSGIWQGTWNPSATGTQVTLQLAASEGSLTLNSAIASSETVAVQAASTPAAARPSGIVNAAAGAQATPQIVAPGSYVAIYGAGLTSGAAVSAAGIPLPTSLGGTQLFLGGQPLPLTFAGPGQINAIIPQNLNSGASYPLLIVNGSTQSVPVPLTVTELQPGIYTYDSSGSGQGIAEIAGTASLASASTPATRGTDYLQIYCTGLGPVSGPNGEAAPADGAAASSTILYRTRATVTATIGGVNAPVQFAGLTPTLVAFYQVNVQVPANAPAGNAVPLVITVTDPGTATTVSSNTVTIALR